MRATLAVLLFTLISIAFSEVNDREAFNDFKIKYNKEYYSEPVENYRFQVFQENLRKIEDLQRKNPGKSSSFGITKFFDLTPEEFREKYLIKNPITPSDSKSEILSPKIVEEPALYDWRMKGAVTPVKNQGQCGSCWAFSVTENIESVWILAGKGKNSSVDLAPQQIVDCDSTDNGCDGGNPTTAYQYVIQAGGLEGETNYPYTAQDGSCKFQKSDVVAKISKWKYACSSKDEHTLQKNLVSWAPLSICVDAEYWQYYSGGVMTAWECAWINQLDHCVQLVGYNTNAKTPYWIVRNSWGTDWGISGYIYLEMWDNTCGMTEVATTSIV